MDAIWRIFLFQGNCHPNEHKYHLVKWDEVIQSKKVGGLGIRKPKIAESKPFDEMAMEICITGTSTVEGDNQG